eukprot:SAG31_NODE_2223_length_6152_cov_4.129688_2_plen_218_part_00
MPLLLLALAAGAARSAAAGPAGLTLTHFGNTASAGAGASAVLTSLERFADCAVGSTCAGPSSLLLTGRVAPLTAGNYGFQLTFDPPLAYPSNDSYAYLWVHDHLLYPVNTGEAMGAVRAGGGAPLWIPLPPRALNLEMSTIEHDGAANLSSYEVRFQYVCRAAGGCGGRKISLRWAIYESQKQAVRGGHQPPPSDAATLTTVHADPCLSITARSVRP